MIETLLQNELATGLSAATMIGGLMYLAREVPRALWRAMKRQFSVEVEVLSEDQAFGWLAQWMAHHEYSATARRLRLSSIWQEDSDTSQWSLSPGMGLHLIWHRGFPMLVSREIREGGAAAGMAREQKERITLTAVGRSQAFLRSVVSDARFAMTGEDGLTLQVWHGYWGKSQCKSARPIATVNLADGQMERIVADLERFLASRDWYLERGIPYRRAYLFSGPPGTGKTTTIMALAAHVGRSICVINLGSINGDDALFDAIATAPRHSILLFEDIDCATASKDRAKATAGTTEPSDEGPTAVTKAGLLNALDGVTTPDGRIFMMTTNYPDRLDAALLRPGRADVHERLGYLHPDDQRRMAARFYGAWDGPVCAGPISPAELQGAFMRFPEGAGAAFAWLTERNDHG